MQSISPRSLAGERGFIADLSSVGAGTQTFLPAVELEHQLHIAAWHMKMGI